MQGCCCCYVGPDDKPCTALATVQIEDIGPPPREQYTHACDAHAVALLNDQSKVFRFGTPGDSDTVPA